MGGLKYTIKSGCGSFSKLDKEYRNFLTEKIKNNDEIDRLEVYDLIMSELISCGLVKTFDEIKYRLTDGEDPNKVMLEVINRQNYESNVLWLVKNRILMFIEDDLHKHLTE